MNKEYEIEDLVIVKKAKEYYHQIWGMIDKQSNLSN